jgi:hypothetical protein
MKDLFDYCEFGDLKLNSRIVRTGLWESEREKSETSHLKYITDMKISPQAVSD